MVQNSSIVVLWVYTVLLVAGGLMGFLKAKSKVSLITSVIFAVPLVLTALHYTPLLVADVVIGLLIVVFGIRFAKGKKFMPSGMMVLMSVIALGALLILH
jgi:uncharacterized membrane protein (UPF0136 family)